MSKLKPLAIVDDRHPAGDDGMELAPDDPEAEKLMALADIIVYGPLPAPPKDARS